MICLRNVGSTARVPEKIKVRNQHQHWTAMKVWNQ
jgi:hypothetical protein